MHLHKLILDNFKSHEHSVISFALGTNAICGKNYAGKSTIVQAIGLTLFDFSPGHRNGDFVREGTTAATISVELISALDERLYRVTRKIKATGSASEWQVRDPELGKVIVTGSEDVTDWLRDHLGVGRETDLASLFGDAIGVSQGELTAAFTQTPGPRQKQFNALLRIEEYKSTFDRMLEATNHMKSEIGKVREHIAGLDGETRDLPQKEQEARSLRNDINARDTRQASQDTLIADLECKVEAGAEIATRIKTLNARIQKLQRWEAVRNIKLRHANAQLTEAGKAAKVVADNADSHATYEHALAEQVALQSFVDARSIILARKAERDAKHVQSQAIMDLLRNELTEITVAEQEVSRLSLLVAKQTECESHQETAKMAVAEAKAALQVAQEGQSKSRDGQCPFLRANCQNVATQGATLPQYFDGRITELKQTVTDLQAVVQRRQTELASLGKAPLDPRTRYAVAQNKAERRIEQEKRIREHEETCNACAHEVAKLNELLLPYIGLDTKIKECNTTVSNHRKSHSLYEVNLRTAETMPACERAVQQAQKAINRVQRVLAQRRGQLEHTSSQYDADAHAQLSRDLNKACEERAANRRVRDEKQKQSDALETALLKLRAKMKKLNRTRQKVARLEAVQQHLDYIRRTIRDAGPLVTTMLVGRISRDAQEFFRALIGDNSLGLRWTEDYEIVLLQNGRERGLDPAAGSERVAAALAVRLALLQNMGDIRLAFFDEPTIHLDPERREKLAERLVSLPCFSQMFVISHDDTFERNTNHVIHVEKRDGKSIVTTS